MKFQNGQVELRPKEPTPRGVGCEPRHYEDDCNRPDDAAAARSAPAASKQREEEKV